MPKRWRAVQPRPSNRSQCITIPEVSRGHICELLVKVLELHLNNEVKRTHLNTKTPSIPHSRSVSFAKVPIMQAMQANAESKVLSSIQESA